MKKIIIALVILSFLIPTMVSAAVDCRTYYTIKSGDTIEKIMKLYKVTAWDVIGSNRNFMLPPNYPPLVGAKACIPRNTGNTKYVSKSIIQAPAGEFSFKQANGKLTVMLAYWAKSSNWIVKFDGVKIGKIKVPDKNVNFFSFRTNKIVKRVCLKNYLTDYVICR